MEVVTYVVRGADAGDAEVAVGGRDLSCWTFDANNVLAWEDEAGFSAWLQFTVLPGGPVFMGTLDPKGEEADPAGAESVTRNSVAADLSMIIVLLQRLDTTVC